MIIHWNVATTIEHFGFSGFNSVYVWGSYGSPAAPVSTSHLRAYIVG